MDQKVINMTQEMTHLVDDFKKFDSLVDNQIQLEEHNSKSILLLYQNIERLKIANEKMKDENNVLTQRLLSYTDKMKELNEQSRQKEQLLRREIQTLHE